MSEEAGTASEQQEPQQPSADPVGHGLARSTTVRRLRYDGEDGQQRRIRILTACMQFKASLFGTGKRSEIYQMVATDMNKYFPDLFHGLLKDSGVQTVWNGSLKDAESQKRSMEEERHKWFNGNVLREMSDLEKLLAELQAEKEKVDRQREADKAAEAAEEADARLRKNIAIDKVQQRYDAGKVVHPHNRSSDTEPEEEKTPPKQNDGEGGGPGYGRGTRKGNDKMAGGNPGLSPDAKPDKLTEAMQKQGDVAQQIADLAKKIAAGEEDTQPKRSAAEEEAATLHARAAKIQATAALMEQYLKFVLQGIPIPPILQRMVEEEDES